MVTAMPSDPATAFSTRGAEEDVTEAMRVLLAPARDRVTVHAGEQSVEPFDHIDARAQRAVDRRHLEAYDAAADHQHALGNEGQLQRPGGIDDARIAGRKGRRTAEDPAATTQC